MVGNEAKIIRLSITQKDVDRYNTEYFEKYPKRKKPPIDRPIHPSLNQWTTIKNRMVMNSLKQTWKDFAVRWCEWHGVAGMMIEDYAIEYTTYMPSARRADPDNYTCKFLLDGFVEAGFLVDDDGRHMRALILRTSNDKTNPRTDITVKIYGANKEDNK